MSAALALSPSPKPTLASIFSYVVNHSDKIISVISLSTALQQTQSTEQRIRIALQIANTVAGITPNKIDDDLVELLTVTFNSPEIKAAALKLKSHFGAAWQSAA